ncbi:MAG: glycosyltransferase [Cyanobacteria bacterium P01_G01_bin.38]
MKKIMIYCQHLAGMGHLVRSAEIIRNLVKDFRVCFINGGQPVPQFELPTDAEVIYLPGLWQDGKTLRPVEESKSLDEVKLERQQKLLGAFERFGPDCLITECFPFSKLKMKFELMPLLKQIRASPQPIRVVCSLRDLIMTQPMEAEAWLRRADRICELINRYYDAVFFHGDANFLRLEDCFPRVNALQCEVIYTGYVAQSPPRQQLLTIDDIAGLSDQAPIIVASVGGGRHGYELLRAVIAVGPLLAKTHPHQIYAFAGPFMPAEDFAQLQQAAAGSPNVTLRRFTSRLIDYLQKADLSVSLGGYNTTMNLLKTGVRSLILPSLSKDQNNEQHIRAQKLAERGVLDLLVPADLAPDRLVKAIIHRLDTPPTPGDLNSGFNLQGADNTARHIQRMLATPVSPVPLVQ